MCNRISAITVSGCFFVLGACAGPSEAVRNEIAHTSASVQQVQQSGAIREAGALQLQQAKDKLAEARIAVDRGDEQRAMRLAQQARLDADLAQAKARSDAAQRAAAELRASLEQLRNEALPPTTDLRK